jgi:hypothetical protein
MKEGNGDDCQREHRGWRSGLYGLQPMDPVQGFPKFMEGVESIEQLDSTTLRWVAEIGGVKRRLYRIFI